MMSMWAWAVAVALVLALDGYILIGLYFAARFRRRLKGAPRKVGRLVVAWGMLLAWAAWPYYAGFESGYNDGYDAALKRRRRR